ncbi:MAG: DNA-methyltransferase [Promethearchaeota archaeon]
MSEIEDESIELMITSPPYPMIEMWDDIFSLQNEDIKKALEKGEGSIAFEKMNGELDKVWKEVYRVLIPGGIACINIGDATRSINKNFQIFPSHARIISSCQKIGFQNLPEILWRKQTNAPNKFMGSGMLPPGAYVTLEHEFILIFRKGRKREFKKKEASQNRRESSYFWEERNIWFSDIWDLRGSSQDLSDKKARKRSAAYPFELAYRLIIMFSVRNDTVLDPFLGTGTSSIAAMVSERNSLGYEIDFNLKNTIEKRFFKVIPFGNKIISDRITAHKEFINKMIKIKGSIKYYNEYLKVPVTTSQEKQLKFNKLISFGKGNNEEYLMEYEEIYSETE